MQITSIKQGVPSWVELATTDEVAAIRFYGGLFGWTDQPESMGEGMGDYHMQTLQGDPVAAINAQQPMERDQGVPPHWNIYIAVDSVDEVAPKVPAAGGTLVVPPFDVLDSGRMAVIMDPTGGFVSLWQAKEHQGFRRMREPNTVAWCELITDEPKRASSFFSSILGVPSIEMSMGDDPPYTILGPQGDEAAGIMQKRPEMQFPNVWMVYFEVADADATAARAKELGGAVYQEPVDIMPGRMAVLADAQGATFGIIKSAPMEAPR